MEPAPLHPDEHDRLESLRALNVLDTESEERFDRLTELAAMVLDVPIALVSLVDVDRQWFKSNHGIDARQTPREIAFCSHAILEDDDGTAFVVDDAALDQRFFDNPLVTDDPHIRFYAGQVLRTRGGYPVGTLCAIDRRPRSLSAAQAAALSHIAALVEEELHGQTLAQRAAAVAASEQKKSLILGSISEGLVLQDQFGNVLESNAAAERLLGLSHDEVREGRNGPYIPLTHEDGRPVGDDERPSTVALLTGERVDGMICGYERPDGDRIWLKVSVQPTDDEHGDRQIVSTFSDITKEVEERRERVRLEASLQRQVEFAQTSLDALDQGVMLVDFVNGVRLANTASKEILGFTTSEMTSRWNSGEWETFDQFGKPIDFAERPAVSAMRTGQPVIDELVQWRRRSGELALLRLTCIPNADGSGAMVLAFTDITEEHLSQRMLDTTLEMASAGLALLDSDGNVTRCNPAFAEHVGRSFDSIVGASVFELVHPEDRQQAFDDRQRLVDGVDTHVAIDNRVTRADGSEGWVHTQIAVVPGSNGQVAIASTFDVTERRELLRDVSRFSYLFEQSNDMISIVDRDGNIMYRSPANNRILGHPSGSVPESIYERIHPDDVHVAARALPLLVSSDKHVDPFTVRTRTGAGGWLHIEYSGVNLLDEPAVSGLVFTGRDVTQRVALTEQLQHLASHDTLTNLVNRRAAHDQLGQSIQRSTRVNRRVGLCFIDLDGFKSINDEYGHATGDEALRLVAECLRNSLRAGDTAARLGGDEFVVILDPVDSVDDVQVGARRILDRIAGLTNRPGMDRLGASIGITVNEPGDDASSMLRRADAAMYRAKADGRGAIAIADCDASPDSPWTHAEDDDRALATDANGLATRPS